MSLIQQKTKPPRSVIIRNVFNRIKYFHNISSGLQRISNACKRNHEIEWVRILWRALVSFRIQQCPTQPLFLIRLVFVGIFCLYNHYVKSVLKFKNIHLRQKIQLNKQIYLWDVFCLKFHIGLTFKLWMSLSKKIKRMVILYSISVL